MTGDSDTQAILQEIAEGRGAGPNSAVLKV